MKISSKDQPKLTQAEDLFSAAQSVLCFFLILILISSFWIRISGVSGSSMFPTLVDGDRVLVNLFDRSDPQRGDIIVIIAQDYDNKPLVKRIIGLPGDIIDIDGMGTVRVNGRNIDEHYINEPIFGGGDKVYPYTVPDGCLFVMGDNRNASADSRLISVGQLREEKIIGKVFFRIWPLTRFGKIS